MSAATRSKRRWTSCSRPDLIELAVVLGADIAHVPFVDVLGGRTSGSLPRIFRNQGDCVIVVESPRR